MITPRTVADLTGFFRADQICTPIASATAVELTEAPRTAYDRLKSARFDQAPVMRNGRPVGWITTDALGRQEAVKSAMTAFDDCILVSAESSIARILPMIVLNRFLYVIGAGEVLGFIVHSDLDRHAVRSYLYLLIAGVEMQLSEIVERSCKRDVIVKEIDGRLEKAFRQAQDEGLETSPVEYLYLKPLIKLFGKEARYDRRALWNEELMGQLHTIESFRNDVMHANKSLAASAKAANIGSLPSCAAEVSEALGLIIDSLAPAT